MPKRAKKGKINVNPKSLENLRHEGRPPAFDEEKKRRTLSVTESGWEGAMSVAKGLDCRGISEMIEWIGRGQLRVVEVLSSDSEAESEAETQKEG